MSKVLQKRMSCFVDWIAPDPKSVPETRAHAINVLKRLGGKAEEHDIPVVETLIGGSFDKKTGLRRHMRGDNEIEGQDIDLVFVVDHEDDEKYFTELVSKFTDVVGESYPDSEKTPTKCSVQLEFKNPLVTYDVVPVYKTSKDKHQMIVRTDMERRLTSVQLHTEFIQKRTLRSKQTAGVVEFNECIRLIKWWRCTFVPNAFYLKDGVPSVLIELIFAKIFDQVGVKNSYAETLAHWFSLAASSAQNRNAIFFNDYIQGTPNLNSGGVNWFVFDPVNLENNITKKWSVGQCQELAQGFKSASENLMRAIRHNEFGEDTDSLESLIKVFGSAIKNHCGEI